MEKYLSAIVGIVFVTVVVLATLYVVKRVSSS